MKSIGKVNHCLAKASRSQMIKNLRHTIHQVVDSPLNIGLPRSLILRGLTLLAHEYETAQHFSPPKLPKICIDDFFKVLLILNKSSISPLSRKMILEGLQLLSGQYSIEEEAWYSLLAMTSSHVNQHQLRTHGNDYKLRVQVYG